MGYELDQLQKQYGVSSPSLSYAGSLNPATPAPGPAADGTDPQATYQALLAKYQADQAKYDAYKKDYQGRVAATPMYSAAQFRPAQPGPSWESSLQIPTYAEGGSVEGGDPAEFRGLDMSRVTPAQLRQMQQQDPQAMMRGVTRFAGNPPVEQQPAAPVQAAPGPGQLDELLTKYMTQGDVHGEEFSAARQKAAAHAEAFDEMIKRSMEQKTEGPSKAEMYFRLASAFGAPTKTGGFAESLGKANEVMGDYSKETRTAAQADIARRQQLGMSAQQAKMLAAKQDVDSLRALAAEEMRDKRALGVKMLEQRATAAKPMSEAGKIANDLSLVPGTPAYTEFVRKRDNDKIESGDYFKTIMAGIAQQGADARDRAEVRRVDEGKKLTPSEVHLKTGTEDMLASTDQAMANLDRAFRLNPNTFDSSLVDKAQRLLLEQGGSKDPKVLATREQMNLLEKAALSQLKSTFPGAISNDERKVLMSVQGLESKSIEERALIMRQAYNALKTVRARSNKRLNEINQGLYRETVPRPPAEDGGFE